MTTDVAVEIPGLLMEDRPLQRAARDLGGLRRLDSRLGWLAKSRRSTTRLQANLDRAETETALLREELAIKDARWSRVRHRRRPYYSPTKRTATTG